MLSTDELTAANVRVVVLRATLVLLLLLLLLLLGWLRELVSYVGEVLDGASALAVIRGPDEEKPITELVNLNHNLET